ncbi:MAG: hypothetical protein CO035_00325, partial [Candidatus Omnitrophica bacterium CG_4_9_14_0_2_um_filter_42_8]
IRNNIKVKPELKEKQLELKKQIKDIRIEINKIERKLSSITSNTQESLLIKAYDNWQRANNDVKEKTAEITRLETEKIELSKEQPSEQRDIRILEKEVNIDIAFKELEGMKLNLELISTPFDNLTTRSKLESDIKITKQNLKELYKKEALMDVAKPISKWSLNPMKSYQHYKESREYAKHVKYAELFSSMGIRVDSNTIKKAVLSDRLKATEKEMASAIKNGDVRFDNESLKFIYEGYNQDISRALDNLNKAFEIAMEQYSGKTGDAYTVELWRRFVRAKESNKDLTSEDLKIDINKVSKPTNKEITQAKEFFQKLTISQAEDILGILGSPNQIAHISSFLGKTAIINPVAALALGVLYKVNVSVIFADSVKLETGWTAKIKTLGVKVERPKSDNGIEILEFKIGDRKSKIVLITEKGIANANHSSKDLLEAMSGATEIYTDLAAQNGMKMNSRLDGDAMKVYQELTGRIAINDEAHLTRQAPHLILAISGGKDLAVNYTKAEVKAYKDVYEFLGKKFAEWKTETGESGKGLREYILEVLVKNTEENYGDIHWREGFKNQFISHMKDVLKVGVKEEALYKLAFEDFAYAVKMVEGGREKSYFWYEGPRSDGVRVAEIVPMAGDQANPDMIF